MSVGASGAIFGLIGVLIGGSLHDVHLGKEYHEQLWLWLISILILGLFFLSLWWGPFPTLLGALALILGFIVLIRASFHYGHLGKEYREQFSLWVIFILIFALFFLSLWWGPYFRMYLGDFGVLLGFMVLVRASLHDVHLGKEYREQLWLWLISILIGLFFFSLYWGPYFRMLLGGLGLILGVIVLIRASFHHSHLGKEYRVRLWLWVFFILLLGFFFGGDNAAHIGGLGAGVLLGYLVPEGEAATRASQNLWNLLAVLSMVIIAGSFVLMALQLGRPLR
jgi:hypothetical protein